MNAGLVSAGAAWRRTARDTITASHPGWWLSAAAGSAWTALVVWSIGESSAHHHGTGGHGGHHMDSPTSDLGGAGLWIGHWLLMVIAMMWPLYALPAAAVAQASFRRWRAANVAAYIVAISVLWVGVGVIARGGFVLVEPMVPGWVWSVAWLLVAIGLTRSVWRARLLRRCGQRGVVAPSGRRGLVTAAVEGARSWPRCAALCGPVMLAMVPSHQLLLMVGGSAAVWWEQRHPRAWRDPVPVVVLAVTAIAVLISHFGGSGHG